MSPTFLDDIYILMGKKGLTWAMTIFMNSAILPQLTQIWVVLLWFRLMGLLPRVTQLQVPANALQSLLLSYKLQTLLKPYAGLTNTRKYASDPAYRYTSSHRIYYSGQRKQINSIVIPYSSSYFQNMSLSSWLHHVLPSSLLNNSVKSWLQLSHFLDQMRAHRKSSVLLVIRKVIWPKIPIQNLSSSFN